MYMDAERTKNKFISFTVITDIHVKAISFVAQAPQNKLLLLYVDIVSFLPVVQFFVLWTGCFLPFNPNQSILSVWLTKKYLLLRCLRWSLFLYSWKEDQEIKDATSPNYWRLDLEGTLLFLLVSTLLLRSIRRGATTVVVVVVLECNILLSQNRKKKS